jgi:hypothetical protein
MPNNKRLHRARSKHEGNFAPLRPGRLSGQEPAPADQEHRDDSAAQEEMGTNRIEAFSDGVFAIAITLFFSRLSTFFQRLPIGFDFLPVDRYWRST